MAEYIEREALLTEIAKGTIITDDSYGMGIMAGVDAVSRMVMAQPAADVAPVVRSEWEILTDDSGNEYMRCKQCGEEFYDGDNDTVDTKHNFCPNCGADMREVE